VRLALCEHAEIQEDSSRVAELSLEEIHARLLDSEGYIPMSSYYIIETLVEEYGAVNIVKAISDAGRRLRIAE
jgi:hypothetical protein